MSAYSDEQLVLEALDDSNSAFEQLVKQYQYRVLRTIASIISDEQAAQDVAQETFLLAWRDLPELKEKQKFGRWLNKIAISSSKVWLRKQRKYHENAVPLKEDAAVLTWERKYQRDRLRQKIWDAIDELSADYRESVILYYISGYSYKEISEMLSVPVSTVQGRLQQARNQLRKEFLDMVRKLQLEMDSTLHNFLREHAEQDGTSIEGLIVRLIEKYKRDTDAGVSGTQVAEPVHRVVLDDQKEFKITQVWSGPDVDTYGTASPDGRYLSYTDWETGDLAIRELATGKKRRLTKKGTQKQQPAIFALNSIISPDSKLVAYSWTNEYGTYDLCLIGIDGSGERTLYSSTDKDEVYPASWSSDGKQIAARRYGGGKTEIISIAVADGSVQVLKTFEKLFWPGLCYSPDHRFIAYDFPVAKNSGNYDISLLATDGSGEIPLIEHPANDRLLGWVPNREEILFVSDRAGTHDMWAIEVANGKVKSLPRPVKRDIGQISSRGFIKDGSFYFSIHTRRSTTQIAPFDSETGKIQEELSKPLLGSNFFPEWSPDGKYLAYVTEQTGSAGPGFYHRPLHVLNLGTGEERELGGEFQVRAPRWSPDGRSILITGKDRDSKKRSQKGYNGGLYKIDVQDGHVTELVQFPPVQDFFRDTWWTSSIAEWSLDGKAVFYINRGKIFMRELESSREKQLYQNNNLARLLDLSPDGKRLVFGTDNHDEGTWSILIMPVSGEEPRELCKLQGSERIRDATWTPDGNYVLFSKREKKGSTVWRISAGGGDPEMIRGAKAPMAGANLSVHPNGEEIAFCTYMQEQTIWAMENFLPESTTGK